MRRAVRRRDGALVCVYGRRRLGKSRLLHEALAGLRHVYYVGDERDAALQRADLAREMASVLPGFADATYPGWLALLERWWREAPSGTVLALDEFPFLVRASPELPSLLQKLVDRPVGAARSIILCGSSQRMMQGLVLDSTAPLYGRAREIIRLGPLGLGWIGEALGVRDAAGIIDHWAVWGGVPRYWELAAERRELWAAIQDLVLDPLGVLHREPERLLLDDVQDGARASSILALIGAGCHRVSEIGGRLGVPATSLSRPLARLIDLGLICREVPFGRSVRDTKRTFYRIADPFLRFWYGFVEPNRSRLAAGRISEVERDIRAAWPRFLGATWEELARASVPHLVLAGTRWMPAQRWWGRDRDGAMLELDVVARSVKDPARVLVGEAKLAGSAGALAALADKARRCPDLEGMDLTVATWILRARRGGDHVVNAAQVARVLR